MLFKYVLPTLPRSGWYGIQCVCVRVQVRVRVYRRVRSASGSGASRVWYMSRSWLRCCKAE